MLASLVPHGWWLPLALARSSLPSLAVPPTSSLSGAILGRCLCILSALSTHFSLGFGFHPLSVLKAILVSQVDASQCWVCVLSHSVVSNTLQPCRLLFMGLSWQEYLSGLPFPPLVDLADPRIEPTSPEVRPLASRAFTSEAPRKPKLLWIHPSDWIWLTSYFRYACGREVVWMAPAFHASVSTSFGTESLPPPKTHTDSGLGKLTQIETLKCTCTLTLPLLFWLTGKHI